MSDRDIVVIGGGVNGLTCAAYLARAGLKPLVLERRGSVGGGAITGEIAPGFNVPTLAHRAGPLAAQVVNDLELPKRGLSFVDADVDVAILGGAQPLVLWRDAQRTVDSLRAVSGHDASAWPLFQQRLTAISGVIATLFTHTPPSVDDLAARDLWTLLRTLRAFRSLHKQDAYRLLRWGPMAVADLVTENFETEALRAGVAADGIFGTNFGPWSAGSGLVWLLAAANQRLGGNNRIANGGPGAIAAALAAAATHSGAEIRLNASVARVLTTGGAVSGIALDDGSEIPVRNVVSALDPKTTFVRLCDPMDLAPEFLWRARNYRAHGTVAKLNLALSTLPAFASLPVDALRGLVRIAPDLDYLEQAFDHSKYGRYSTAPFIEFTVPTLLDPSLAPKGAHVLSAYIQFAPYKLRDMSWDTERDPVARIAVDTLELHAPGLRNAIVAQQLITPLDLEREYGFNGGHIFHGELALDQMLTMRPLLGWGHYRSPVEGLFLCGSGTHPGTGMTGLSGLNAAREVVKHRR
jgi:phytoene dehydrogenase-like protein